MVSCALLVQIGKIVVNENRGRLNHTNSKSGIGITREAHKSKDKIIYGDVVNR